MESITNQGGTDMSTTTTEQLTTDHLDAMTTDDRWGGWGYLGERERGSLTAEHVARADAGLLEAAAGLKLDAEQLFHFANSKMGRFYADETSSARDAAEARGIARQRLLEASRYGVLAGE